jgi:ubiquinone biosynthesis accessory factor UbiK
MSYSQCVTEFAWCLRCIAAPIRRTTLVPCTALVRWFCAGSGLLHSTQQGGAVDTKFIDEISRRTQELIANTPVEDVQKNLRALMSGWFSRLDLVTRAELDVQQEVLRRTREKLAQMEARIAQLEQQLKKEGE